MHSSTTNADSRLVELPSKNTNITFDLHLVEPLNDFETDDSELFQNEKLNQVIIKTAYQSITQHHPLFSSSLVYMDTYQNTRTKGNKKKFWKHISEQNTSLLDEALTSRQVWF